MPEKNGEHEYNLEEYHKLGADNIRLNACETYALQQNEVDRIAKEILTMHSSSARLNRLKALKLGGTSVSLHHCMVVDRIKDLLEAESKRKKDLKRAGKIWLVHVCYDIHCSHDVEVVASDEQDAKEKAAQVTYDTDMTEHINDSTISEIAILRRPEDGKFKNPSGQVGSKQSAGSKNKGRARSRRR